MGGRPHQMGKMYSSSLHHMADLLGMLGEMKRVLNPGGFFIIAEMYRDGQTETQMTHVLLHHWWAAVDAAMGVTHHETFTRQQILNIVDGLGLEEVRCYDLSDTGEDPKQHETIRELDGIIDRYIERARGVPEQDELQKRGEELRRRVHEVGFHGAASLIVIGKKPSVD